jgi:hypothetical protein
MWFLVLVYLVAIVAANLSVAYFGPSSVIINAFVFIGLDLTTRDGLHEMWQGRSFILKMGGLIACGSLITVILNWGALQIAIASMVAFAGAAIVDTIVYSLLHDKAKIFKSNGSNLFSSATDSILFPSIAFGSFMPAIILGQFAAKFVGGFLWSLLFHKTIWSKEKAVSDTASYYP